MKKTKNVSIFPLFHPPFIFYPLTFPSSRPNEPLEKVDSNHSSHYEGDQVVIQNNILLHSLGKTLPFYSYTVQLKSPKTANGLEKALTMSSTFSQKFFLLVLLGGP